MEERRRYTNPTPHDLGRGYCWVESLQHFLEGMDIKKPGRHCMLNVWLFIHCRPGRLCMWKFNECHGHFWELFEYISCEDKTDPFTCLNFLIPGTVRINFYYDILHTSSHWLHSQNILAVLWMISGREPDWIFLLVGLICSNFIQSEFMQVLSSFHLTKHPWFGWQLKQGGGCWIRTYSD